MPAQIQNHVPTIRDLLARRGLRGHFQPIVDISRRTILAHEGLIRGPEGSPLHLPAELFRAAQAQGLSQELEFAAARTITRQFAAGGHAGLLFLNFSAHSIAMLGSDRGRAKVAEALSRYEIPARTLVVEVTEHERVQDHAVLAEAVRYLRSLGIAIALDDFGDGRSSLRLWAELQPEYVKIDRYFSHNIHLDGRKVQSVKAMMQLADSFGSRIIAEGIETGADLLVVRDLGVSFVQGYIIGRPQLMPQGAIHPQASVVLGSAGIAVFPERGRISKFTPRASELLITAPAITAANTNQQLLALFQQHPQVHALAVLEEDRPIGLVNRQRFTEKFLLPFYQEIYGRKSCMAFMEPNPVVIEISEPIEELAQVLTSDDQRYLSDGFVLVDGGRYVGMGTAERLVRRVTEQRIEAARHANPLTFLPGNIPISEHIRRLVSSDASFAACYCDLNNFKPFNDRYGYWQGDKMIQLLAGIIVAECDPRRDFAGHVGGDDFVVMFQSRDWAARCTRIIARLNESAPALYEPVDRGRGWIASEDRRGIACVFPLITLSIGAVIVQPGTICSAEDVATAAADAKHHAKKAASGLYVREFGDETADRAPAPLAASA